MTRSSSSRSPSRRRTPTRSVQGSRAGFALMMAMITVAILAVLVTEFHGSTGTAFAAANMQRDRLKAEYLARSGINLTRMLIQQERQVIRPLANSFYQMLGKRAPQIPVWEFADYLLKPFADLEGSEQVLGEAGFDLSLAEGLGELGGTFEIIGTAENAKLNVNKHLRGSQEQLQARLAQELYVRFGGLNSPSIYDRLFSEADDKGRLVTRLDLISNIIDWWDYDQTRAQYDFGANQVVSAGGEDNSFYREQEPPYEIKNAPFDTFEELHLVHGMTDDIWATFADPDPNDPRKRQFTIYGTGSVNINGSAPQVILAAICDTETGTIPLCVDPQERIKFQTVLEMVQMLSMGAPLFSTSDELLQFMEGKGFVYTLVAPYLQSNPALAFTPVVFPDPKKREQIQGKLVAESSIITIQSTGHVGRARKRLRIVLNVHGKWVGPPGTTAQMSPLGIVQYYRLD